MPFRLLGAEPWVLTVLVYHGIDTHMTAGTLFHVEPTSGVPIYRQLLEQVLALRAGGRLKPGEFLPSVRQVAEELQVNPMTVSKAWSLLEHDGVVTLVRGKGMCIAAPEGGAANTAQRLQEIEPLLNQVVARAHQLALGRKDVLGALDKLLPKDKP